MATRNRLGLNPEIILEKKEVPEKILEEKEDHKKVLELGCMIRNDIDYIIGNLNEAYLYDYINYKFLEIKKNKDNRNVLEVKGMYFIHILLSLLANNNTREIILSGTKGTEMFKFREDIVTNYSHIVDKTIIKIFKNYI